jgi:hypothetical protein
LALVNGGGIGHERLAGRLPDQRRVDLRLNTKVHGGAWVG